MQAEKSSIKILKKRNRVNYNCKTSEITALDMADKIQSAWRAKNNRKWKS